MKALREQVQKLKIPYPQKWLFWSEVQEHLSCLPLRSDEAEVFSDEELMELYEIHNSFLFKFLDRRDPKIRMILEYSLAASPMVGFLVYLGKEGFMFEFIREGGVAMLPILVLGLLLTLRELSLFFRLVVIKDHSKMKLDVTALSTGGMALLALGLGATALGIYYSANATLSQHASGGFFIEGVKESMGPLIVSSGVAAFVLILHLTLRQLMEFWKAPIA